MANYEVDYSELVGKKAECIDGCGMCCLCQPEVLPSERAFFKKNHPKCLVKSRGPEPYFALALKKDRGSCVFLGECDRRCKVYDHRTTYCRQFPYHIYVSDHVKVELDLSCRGLWTGKGVDAVSEAKVLVANAEERIKEALPQASDVYRQFYEEARSAGVLGDPSLLRMSVSENLVNFTDVNFLAKLLSLAEVEAQVSINGVNKDTKVDMKELSDAARATSLESLSSDDPLSLPVYSAEDLSWNVFSHENGVIEWMTIGDDGEFHHKGFVNADEVELKPLEEDGRKILQDYISVLNGRDSFLGSVYYLIDFNGYEDDMSNAYYGCLVTAILDILWRAALLDKFFGTGMGARGIREAIIFYDMDRLDAPAIGAFV
ncbi:MAG: YkgJ family cysteine cluster protein [archaeon]|nr:YkgJ family cysteine cluster protein [archaeon]